MEETDENGDGNLDFQEFKKTVQLALNRTKELEDGVGA